MKKLFLLVIMATFLSSCSVILPHKNDVVQGNIITQQEVERLHRGMSTSQVKEVMGDPVAVNIFDDNRINYIYTTQLGHDPMTKKHVICIFANGRLAEIINR